MFEAIRKNQRIAQLILALLVIPFAFFGMESYFRDAPGRGEVASVGGSKITVAEFERALRQQQERARNADSSLDRKTLESPEFRRAVLENLVNQRLLALHTAKNNMAVSPVQLREMIASVPAFQEDGRFSADRYKAAVGAQGMTPALFEARLAQDLRTQQVSQAVSDAAFAAPDSARRFLAAQLEEREVSELDFAPSQYLAEVKLAPEAARQYYDANPARFQRPARLKAQYVVFDEAALRNKVTVSEQEMRQFYEANKDRFGVPEERRARHILIQVAANAPAAEVERAKAKAESLLATLRADPSRFEALAKSESQDSGSAAQGGDLGFFGRGAMVKPFEDTAFALKKGEISDVVRSDFGFHIIQLTDIKPSTIRPFDEVKNEIADELRSQAAGRRFAELAEQFSNTVYEQADSLKPAADLGGVQIQTTDWVEREGGAVGPYHNAKLVEALFSDDVVKSHHNTEAIEVANNTLVAARVAEFQPAQRLEFDAVKDSIEKELRTEQAAKRAVEQGEAALAALKKGETVTGQWKAARKLQRGVPALPPDAMQAIFTAPATKVPAYAGVAFPGEGYAVYRIDSVQRPALAKDDPRLASLLGQYQQLMGQRDLAAFLDMLRARYEVKLNLAAITPATQQE